MAAARPPPPPLLIRILLCPIFISLRTGWWAYRGVKGTNWYREAKQRRENRKPEVQRRKRRVSFDGSQTAFGMQMQSDFFGRLPPEVRLVLYAFVVSDRETHVVFREGKFRSYRYMLAQSRPHRPFDVQLSTRGDHEPPSGSMGLLQSCRRIYIEVVGIVYSSSTFCVHDYDTFFALSATLLPDRFQAIRYLHIGGTPICVTERSRNAKNYFAHRSLSYSAARQTICRNVIIPDGPLTPEHFSAFEAACKIIGQMTSLEELHIELDMDWRSGAFMVAAPQLVLKRAQYRHGVETRMLPCLEQLADIGINSFDVSSTERALRNMHWANQPFVGGRRQVLRRV